MNQTCHRKSLNGSIFDNFQMSNHENKTKKPNCFNNPKNAYKHAVISGINYPMQPNTIFKDYNNFPSLSKCYSSTKMTKSQHNIYYLSKSFISFPKEDKDSASAHKDIIKHHRDKSSSTMQSTDERKEVTQLLAELREKKDLIQSLNKTIDNYIKDKAQCTKEMASLKHQLSNYKIENNRLKEEYQYLQASYDKLKNSMKTLSASDLIIKDKDNKTKDKELIDDDDHHHNTEDYEEEEDDFDDDSYKYNEQSLSAICFTDKVKMEKTVNHNNENNHLPALDFGIIAGKREPLNNIPVMNLKISKPNGKNYNDTMPKQNAKANNNYVGQKIIFKNQHHRSEGNLVMNSNVNYFLNCKK